MGFVFPIIMLLAVTGQFVQAAKKGSGDLKSTRIAAAKDALKNEIPYLALIMPDHGTKYLSYCGGTIISSKLILTAAHCFTNNFGDLNKTKLWVQTGEHMSLNNRNGAVLVKQWVTHPDYNPATGDNNIAILQLSSDMVLKKGTAVDKLPLPPQGLNVFDKKKVSNVVQVSGFGNRNITKIGQKGTESAWKAPLQTLEMSLISKPDCDEEYKGAKPEDIFYDKTKKMDLQLVGKTAFCAGLLPLSETGPCLGDDGGPLMCKRADEQGKTVPYLCGVYAGGSGCGLKIPRFYTDVAQYVDWIHGMTSGTWHVQCP